MVVSFLFSLRLATMADHASVNATIVPIKVK